MKLKKVNDTDWILTPECNEDVNFLEDWEDDKVDALLRE